MHIEPTTLGRWPLALYRLLKHQNLPADELLQQSKLELDHLKSNGSRVPVINNHQFWQLALEVSNNPLLGLLFPRYISSNAFMGLGLAMQCAKNLQESLQHFSRLSPLISDAMNITLRYHNDNLLIGFEANTQAKLPYCQAQVDASFATIIQLLQQTQNLMQPFVHTVYYSSARPNNYQSYQDYFSAPVKFNQCIDAIEINHDCLLIANPNADTELAMVNQQMAEAYIQRFKIGNTNMQVELAINLALNEGLQPSCAFIAKQLNLSQRQLQRRLKNANTSVNRELQSVRHRLACQHLQQGRLSLVELTQLLGFADQSNFTKAFKRWQGYSPSAYRKQYSARV